MKRFLIGLILGTMLLFLFLYFGGAGYLETFGKKAEETGRNLKKYEQTTRETARKVGDKYEDVKKKFGSDDDNK